MPLKAALKRSFLRSLMVSVQQQTAAIDLNSDNEIFTLSGAIDAFLLLGFRDLSRGKSTIGTLGFQHESRFAVPEKWRAFNPEDLMEFQGELRELYDDALVTLGTGSHSDTEIFNTMLADDRMQTITSTQKDWTVARFPWARG